MIAFKLIINHHRQSTASASRLSTIVGVSVKKERMKTTRSLRLIGLQAFLLLWQGHSFTGARISTRTASASCLNESPAFKATPTPSTTPQLNGEINFNALSKFVASAVIASTIMIGGAPAVFADEIGVGIEAPTLFTGEEIMVRFCVVMCCYM
jgi:hypothetical protein